MVFGNSFTVTLKITDLPKKDTFGYCDPYFKVFYNGKEQYHSETVLNSSKAYFKSFVLQIVRPADEILIKFFDYDQGTKDEFIGEVVFSGEDFRKGGEVLEQKFQEKQQSCVKLELTKESPDNLVQFDIEVKDIPKTDIHGHCDPFMVIKSAQAPFRILYKTGVKKHKKEVTWKRICLKLDDESRKVNFELYDYEGRLKPDELVTNTIEPFELHGLKNSQKNAVSIQLLQTSTKLNLILSNQNDNSMGFDFPDMKPCYGTILFQTNVKVRQGGWKGKNLTYGSKIGLGKIASPNFSYKKLIITSHAVISIEHLDNRPSGVMMLDRDFEVHKSRMHKKELDVEDALRKTTIRFKNEEEKATAYQHLESVTKTFKNKNENQSFSQVRPNSKAKWFVQGRDYFSYLHSVIVDAKEEIFITDWFLSPKVLLRRGDECLQNPDEAEEYELYKMLIRKADQGIRVRVQIFGPPDYAGLGIAAVDCDEQLNHLHENIECFRHMSGFEDSKLWSHHEKIVVIDQQIAFVGGIDLCSGRWDDDTCRLYDFNRPYKWPGKDYRNTFLFDQGHPKMENWNIDAVNEIPTPDLRKQHCRCPWEDIAMVVYGEAAYDVGVHFIQRWNFTKAQEKKQDVSRMYADHRPILPKCYPSPPHSYHSMEPERMSLLSDLRFKELQDCKAQCLRSSGNWSLGLETTENSIYSAYVNKIRSAKDYIYIENQFFITACGNNSEGIQNRIGEALVDTIIQHDKKGNTDFKVYIVIPHIPEFNFDALDCRVDMHAPKMVMYWQYWSISRGENSIFEKLKKSGINPDDYIFISCLRKWERNPFFQSSSKIDASNKYITSQTIYVHSKLLIVDDRHVIIGSANINDRSLSGDRDSEVCMCIEDVNPEKRGNFATFLRIKVWSMLLGFDPNSREMWGMEPGTKACFEWWKGVCKRNLSLFQKLEPMGPINDTKTYDEMETYKQNYQWMTEISEFDETVKGIQGIMIEFPLEFLSGENLRDAGIITKEGFAEYVSTNKMFT